MTTTQPLSLFISSKMAELAEERQAVQRALATYKMYGWLFEKDAGARPESIQQTYLEEVASCDMYIGLFWQGYGPYTIEEFEMEGNESKMQSVVKSWLQGKISQLEAETSQDFSQDVD